MALILPKEYKSELGILQTEQAIKEVKDFFQDTLSKEMELYRVSAPLFVQEGTGVNDNLNGVERSIRFDVPAVGKTAEIVHSLAKWKRMALKKYGVPVGKGLYTDMNAIRRDEELGNLHSIYVDQWDWEKVITKEQRTTETLKETVEKLYSVFKRTEDFVHEKYSFLKKSLPEKISFVTTQELEDRYPDLTPKEREDMVAKQRGAVFIMQVGGALKSGEKHDGRSPDYDDWTLNGDIIFYNPVLDRAFELSSMGIRVDEETLEKQLEISGCQDRKELEFHKQLLEGKLPYTMGGGIGQSRICMFFLQKAHIGEVQVGVWPEDMQKECEEAGIQLL